MNLPTPIYLTSVKAIDANRKEYQINVRAQKRKSEIIDFHFGYPKRFFLKNSKDGITLLRDGLTLLVSNETIEKLQKFCQ